MVLIDVAVIKLPVALSPFQGDSHPQGHSISPALRQLRRNGPGLSCSYCRRKPVAAARGQRPHANGPGKGVLWQDLGICASGYGRKRRYALGG